MGEIEAWKTPTPLPVTGSVPDMHPYRHPDTGTETQAGTVFTPDISRL